MDRAVLAINSSIWDGERWWVLHIYVYISLSFPLSLHCKSRSRMEGWNCTEGADWPIRRTEKERGTASTFRRYHKPRFGGWNFFPPSRETDEEEGEGGGGRRRKRLSDRVGSDRVVNSSICKTDSPRPFPLHLLLFFFFSPPFSSPSSSPSSLSFFILSIYVSARTRNKFEWNRSAMPSRSPRWW